MPIKYTKLFHLLLDRNIKKGELQAKAEITASIMARLAKNETVRTDTIAKICKALDCQPGDIMEYENDENEKPTLKQALTTSFKAGYKAGISSQNKKTSKELINQGIETGKNISTIRKTGTKKELNELLNQNKNTDNQ